jgi:hypothetical protein
VSESAKRRFGRRIIWWITLEGFSFRRRNGRSYKTDKGKVLSRNKPKPVCRDFGPSVIALEKVF